MAVRSVAFYAARSDPAFPDYLYTLCGELDIETRGRANRTAA